MNLTVLLIYATIDAKNGRERRWPARKMRAARERSSQLTLNHSIFYHIYFVYGFDSQVG